MQKSTRNLLCNLLNCQKICFEYITTHLAPCRSQSDESSTNIFDLGVREFLRFSSCEFFRYDVSYHQFVSLSGGFSLRRNWKLVTVVQRQLK